MTTIRVLFLTDDSEYCHRIAPYFAKHHPDIKLTFSASESGASDMLANKMFSVALIGEEFSGTGINLPGGVAGAYISRSSAECEINGLRCFCRYKSGEALYRIILSMFAEVSNIRQFETQGVKVFAFVGANGGAGATTAAVAFAYKQAALGKRTVYFCCDQFADYTGYLSDNSEAGTLSDLVFIVKSSSGAGSASLKAAAMLKKDISGVRFIENFVDPTDFDNLSPEQIEKMLDIISHSDEFDCVIIDASFYDDRLRRLIMKKADMLFIVSENNPGASAKLKRLLRYLKITDGRSGAELSSRTMIIYNKNSGNDPDGENFDGIGFCGSIPKYKDSNTRNIANAASRLDIWNTVRTN